MDIKNILRVGTVSSLNPANCTARVTFAATDDLVSAELPILSRGSRADKDYWLPDVNEQVLCCFLPNPSGAGVCDGFVLGSFFSTEDAPQESNSEVTAFQWRDGTSIRHDRSTGALDIHASGNITITAAGTITINGSAVYIN